MLRGEAGFDAVELWDAGGPGVPPRLLGALVLGDLVRLERATGAVVELVVRRAVVAVSGPVDLAPVPDPPPPELMALLATAGRVRGVLGWRRRHFTAGARFRFEPAGADAPARLEELVELGGAAGV